jgi:hypothetical protein
MTEDEMKAAGDILKYAQKHPEAKHTAKGIARYWIFQQRLEEKLEVAISAIEYLVDEGFLIQGNDTASEKYYYLNKKKSKKIPVAVAALQKEQEKGKN